MPNPRSATTASFVVVPSVSAVARCLPAKKVIALWAAVAATLSLLGVGRSALAETLSALGTQVDALAASVTGKGLASHFPRELRDLDDAREKLVLCARLLALRP